VEFLTYLAHTFQTLWAELISFVGEKPLIAGIVAAAFLAAVAVPEVLHSRRADENDPNLYY
jgi:hypothetical protein